MWKRILGDKFQNEKAMPGMRPHTIWIPKMQPYFQEWTMHLLLLEREAKQLYKMAQTITPTLRQRVAKWEAKTLCANQNYVLNHFQLFFCSIKLPNIYI